jgi:LemA protein
MIMTLVWVLLAMIFTGAAMVYYFYHQREQAANYLAALDARCDTAFADIDVHLKHRHDLIPRLVEVVKGQTAYEKEIVMGVAQARIEAVKAMSPDIKLEAEKKLSAQVFTLLTNVEKQPDLHALPEFRKLRDELIACDERITAARRFHNLAVEEYNMALMQSPTSEIASRRRMSKRQPFDLGLDRMLMDEPAPLNL